MISATMKASHIIAVLNICKRGDVAFLRKLLASNCNFEEVKDRKGRNALHYCAETDDTASSSMAKPEGRLGCASLLLDSEFKLQEQPDNEGFLPFHHAVIHGNIPLAKLFLYHGVDVNVLVTPPSPDEVCQEAGNTAGSGRSALHLAVIYANYEMLEFLLSGSFEDDNDVKYEFHIDASIQDAQSAIALHYAVQLPEGISASMIKCIVKNSDVDIDSTDAHGRTPLIWAATIGASLSTSILLDLRANPSKAEKSGLTALHCSASRGHTSTVQAIIQHLDKSGLNKEGRKEVLDAQDTDRCTPLFYCVTMGHTNVTKKLLVAGADPNTTDSRGRNLFHCTSRAPSDSVFPTIDLLLENGADPSKVNSVGDTPLHEACSNSNKECVERLLKVPCVAENCISLKNTDNQTPLQISTQRALRAKEQESNNDHVKDVEICQLLVNAGANVDTEDKDGISPLSMVRTCLRTTPNCRPALELERVFSRSANSRKGITHDSPTPVRRDSFSTTIDTKEMSNISAASVSYENSNNMKDVCKSSPRGEQSDLSSSGSLSDTKERCRSYYEKSRKSVNERIGFAASQEDLVNAVEESLLHNENASEYSPKGTPSMKSITRCNSKDISSSVAIPGNSVTSDTKRTESLIPSATKSVSQSTSTRKKSRSNIRSASVQPLEAPIPESQSRRYSTSRYLETLSTSSTFTKQSSRKSHSKPSSRNTTTPQGMRTPRSANKTTSQQFGNGGPSRHSTLAPLQTHRSSNRQTETGTTKGPSSISSSRPVPLKAQHLPAWTQTSFEVSALSNTRHSRLSHSSDRINELAKPKRRPRSSCDLPDKSGGLDGKQKLPQPTITPYLMPVARWPRTMASMLLMGEVSPLYCAQSLNAGCPVKPKKRPTKVQTERVRSAMEARVRLSLAEKELVKLAAQLLDQYDALLIERQKLARTRTTQQVGEEY
nr:Ankyrin [Hymenolepis microstoma]